MARMWRDILTLAGLETIRMKRQAAYWLRLLGVERADSWLYKAYAVGFWVFWAFAMWAFVLEQVELLSYEIPARDAAALLDAMPPLVLVAQLVYLGALFFDPPLKLAAPDLAYVAAAPVSRGAIALFRFFTGMLILAFGLALAGSLVALLFAWSLDAPGIALIGVRAALVTFGLAWLSGAWGWALALARQNTRSAARHAFWLLIPALMLAAWRFPDAILWPGRAWTNAIDGAAWGDGALLVVALVAGLAALIAAGGRAHMARIMDHSQTYARIRKLGIWGQLGAADVVARLRAQSRLARKTNLRGRIPHTSGVARTLLGQSAVVLVRLSPWIVLRLFAAGATVTSIVGALIRFGGASSVQTWALVFIALIQFRPRDAMRVYQTPVERPFLRQFLPGNALLAFAGQASLPLLVMGVGVALGAVAQPWAHPAIALPLALGALLGLALCHALESVRVRGGVLPRVPYEYGVIACGAAVVVGGVAVGSVWGALVAVVLIDVALAALLSRGVPA